MKAAYIAAILLFPSFAFADYVAFQNFLPAGTNPSSSATMFGMVNFLTGGNSVIMDYEATSTVTQFDRVTLPFCRSGGANGGRIDLEIRTSSTSTGPIIASSTLAVDSGNVWSSCGFTPLNATTSTFVLNNNIQWVSGVHIYFRFRAIGTTGSYYFTFNDTDSVLNYGTVACTSAGVCAPFIVSPNINSMTIRGQALGSVPVNQNYGASSTPVICDTFDIGCYISTSIAFLFSPSEFLVSEFENITFASSSPFSYLYDLSGYVDTLRNSTGTPILLEVAAFGATTTILDTAAIGNFQGVSTAKNIFGWVIWIVALFVAYAEVYKFFFKDQV